MPILEPTYKPKFYFKNGFISTVYSGLFRRINGVNQKRERITLNDGDFLDLDWSFSKEKSDRLIILLHGLEGNGQRPYMIGTAKLFNENGIEGIIESAGFSPTTINDPPDPRAIQAAQKYELELSGNSRIFAKKDFDRFDKIYVMDTLNYREVKYLARNDNDRNKIDYLMNVIEPKSNKIVPDPIHSGTVSFEDVIDILNTITDKITENNK